MTLTLNVSIESIFLLFTITSMDINSTFGVVNATLSIGISQYINCINSFSLLKQFINGVSTYKMMKCAIKILKMLYYAKTSDVILG